MAKLAVAGGLLGVLVYLMDWREVAMAIRRADLGWVMAALLVSMAGSAVSAEKWRGLLNASQIRISFGLAARLYWIGSFFSNFLPSSIGGDAVRLMLTPAPGRLNHVAGSILLERVTGLVVLLAITCLGLAVAPWTAPRLAAGHLLLPLVGGLALASTAVLLLPRRAAAFLALVRSHVPRFLRRPVRIAERLAWTVARQTRDRGAILRALVLSVPFYATVVLAQYFCLRAVGADIPLLYALLFGAGIQLLAVLPVSINGLGVSEGAFVALYATFGVTVWAALAAALVRRLVDLANSALGGLLWLAYRADAGSPDDRPAATPVERRHRGREASNLIA
ncbi:MAG: lysylphosphatidylglycerol synthase transmembrane domain-containing protein [Geminicoccaceae bacterium]